MENAKHVARNQFPALNTSVIDMNGTKQFEQQDPAQPDGRPSAVPSSRAQAEGSPGPNGNPKRIETERTLKALREGAVPRVLRFPRSLRLNFLSEKQDSGRMQCEGRKAASASYLAFAKLEAFCESSSPARVFPIPRQPVNDAPSIRLPGVARVFDFGQQLEINGIYDSRDWPLLQDRSAVTPQRRWLNFQSENRRRHSKTIFVDAKLHSAVLARGRQVLTIKGSIKPHGPCPGPSFSIREPRRYMEKPKILIQLDTDPQPSVFDGVVAVDAGVDQLFRHAGVEPVGVRDLVYGAIFTRGMDDLKSTAIFIGGSNVGIGEILLASVKKTMFGPMRVSIMLDSNGSNTTAAAAVLAARKHVKLAESDVLVLAGTGPVGSRVVRLLAAEGAQVRVASRTLDRTKATCDAVLKRVPNAKLTPYETNSPDSTSKALAGAHVVVAAGAPGVELLHADAIQHAKGLTVAIDLSAVPPLGIAGIEVTDKAKERNGVICYGAIGVGGTKMKIHKAAIRKLFTANDLVLDAEEVYRLGVEDLG
jgi:hypothetical protein